MVNMSGKICPNLREVRREPTKTYHGSRCSEIEAFPLYFDNYLYRYPNTHFFNERKGSSFVEYSECKFNMQCGD